MQENNLKKRTDFLIELLSELKNTSTQIQQNFMKIKESSKEFYKNFIFNNKSQIQREIDLYKINNENIKNLNMEVTKQINSWYSFTKNTAETQKIFFPVKFYFKKLQLSKFIKTANENISRLAIENRFIKEHISEWEHEQSINAAQHMKKGTDYLLYEQLIKRQEILISEIKYLLPSIPGLCPVELSNKSIDFLIDRLEKIAAA